MFLHWDDIKISYVSNLELPDAKQGTVCRCLLCAKRKDWKSGSEPLIPAGELPIFSSCSSCGWVWACTLWGKQFGADSGAHSVQAVEVGGFRTGHFTDGPPDAGRPSTWAVFLWNSLDLTTVVYLEWKPMLTSFRSFYDKPQCPQEKYGENLIQRSKKKDPKLNYGKGALQSRLIYFSLL